MDIVSNSPQAEDSGLDQRLPARMAANTAVQVLGRGASLVLNLVATVAIIRYLGVSLYGDYVFITSFAILFGVIGDFGVSKVAVREIAKGAADAGRVLATSVALRLALSFLGMVLCGATITMMGYPVDTRLGVYVTSSVFLINALQSMGCIFQATLAMQYDAAVQVVVRSVDTAIVLWLTSNGGPLLALVAVPVFSGALGVCITLAMVRYRYRLTWAIDLQRLRWMLREASPIGLSLFLVIIYLKTDTLLLSRLVGEEAVGIYGAAYKPAEYLLIIVAALFLNSVFPVLSRLYVGGALPRFERVYQRGFEILMMIIIPLAVVVTVLGEPLVDLVYSSQFRGSAVPMRVLMWAAVAMFAGSYLAVVLIAIGQQRLSLMNDAVGAVINVVLNLMLIPVWSYLGSAVAILITCTVVSGMAHEAIRRQTGLRVNFYAVGRILLASLGAGSVILMVQQANWIVAAACGILSYPFLLLLCRALSLADLRAMFPTKRVVASESKLV